MRRLTIPTEHVRRLYEIGVPVERIATEIGVRPSQVKCIVRRDGIGRDRSRYVEGVAFLAFADEMFRESCVSGYWVSNRGRVIAMLSRPGTVLKQQADKDGYLRVHLCSPKQQPLHMLVHRMVALAFIGGPSPGECVAHNNGIRSDNRVENLRWATQAENVADKVVHGTLQIGSKHARASTDEFAIARLKAAFRTGKTIKQAADMCGVTRHVAADVKRGRSWRHVA